MRARLPYTDSSRDEIIRQLYEVERLSMRKIAAKIHMHQTNVSERVDAMGIERHQVTYRREMDAKVYALYVEQELSQYKVAERLGLKQHVIFKRLRRMGIKCSKVKRRRLKDQDRTDYEGLLQYGELSDMERQRIEVFLALDSGISPQEIAPKVGVSWHHVDRLWRRYLEHGQKAYNDGRSIEGRWE